MNNYKNELLNIIQSETFANYESPNIIPIIKYAFKLGYKIYLCGEVGSILVTLKWLKSEKINPDFIASDITNNNSFININNLQTPEDNHIVILASKNDDLCEYFMSILNNKGFRNIIDVYKLPKVPLLNEEYFSYFNINYLKLIEILDLLEDDYSKIILIEYLRSKFNLDFYRLEQSPSDDKYFEPSLFNINKEENIVNMGSSNGDTLFYYLSANRAFNSWYACEIDNDRINQFSKNIKLLPLELQRKIHIINNKINMKNPLVNFVNDDISLITMDIEGDELEALNASKEIIKKDMPILSISAYHKPSDLIDLPLFMKEINDNYTIFFRKYATTFRNKFRNAELVLYGIPRKRLKK